MRAFTIVPTNARAKAVTFNALNDMAVLHEADRNAFDDAAVFEAGAYKYSLRNEGNVWCIYVSTEAAQTATGALHSPGDSQLS